MVVASEVVERFGMDVDTAVASGLVEREKVQGRWLYFRQDDPGVEDTLDLLDEALDGILEEWLVSPGQYLVGQAVQGADSSSVSHAGCRILMQELCHRERLDGIGLMARSLQPYLAFHRPCDVSEIERQVAAMRSLLERYGTVTWRYLPEPERPVPRQAWRMTILAHGMWLGLGHQPQRGVLEAW